MNMRQILLVGSTVMLLAMSPTWVFGGDHDGRQHHGGLTGADCDAIIAAARAGASGQNAVFRAGDTPPKNHYACVNREGKIVRFASDEDAWEGSRDVAKAKAFTAMAFSSDENALTTRTIFCATQPGGPLWELGNANQAGIPKGHGSINQLGIIQFPGGVPIYIGGKLVGGFGVSGDSIALDEKTALAGTGATYGALKSIKSSSVIGVSYQLSDFGGKCTK
jgi:uncharacterized protein GlcG (DUF336 family)